MRTIVFVDGYNLYYGLLCRSAHKWLDLYTLFQHHALDGDADVVEVRYYTAPVLGRMSDDPHSPQRQRTYLQALRKMPPQKTVIIEGRMVATRPFQRLARPLPQAPELETVQVLDFDEKKTDVNLASGLIAAAWSGACEQVVLCTNDSDIEAALATIRQHCPAVRVGVVAPIPGDDHRRIPADLERHAHWCKTLKRAHLAAAQLPEKIPGTGIRRPVEWSTGGEPG